MSILFDYRPIINLFEFLHFLWYNVLYIDCTWISFTEILYVCAVFCSILTGCLKTLCYCMFCVTTATPDNVYAAHCEGILEICWWAEISNCQTCGLFYRYCMYMYIITTCHCFPKDFSLFLIINPFLSYFFMIINLSSS